MSSGCYFSAKLFPVIGETVWQFVIKDGATVQATGTFTIDKRNNFSDIKGIFTRKTTPIASVNYVGTSDVDRNISFKIILPSAATETYNVTGIVNNANNAISGSCFYNEQPTVTYNEFTWIASKTN